MAATLLLPTQKSLQTVAGQGWRIATRVGASQIPGAGNGRFAEEAAETGRCLSVKPLVKMAHVENLTRLPADRVIAFETTSDLEAYITMNVKEGGYTREAVIDIIENFVWSLDGQRACLCTSTWSMNHAKDNAEGLNVLKSIVDDTVVGTALGPITPGDELRNNYCDFVMPDFYLKYCEENGFADVRTKVLSVTGQLA